MSALCSHGEPVGQKKSVDSAVHVGEHSADMITAHRPGCNSQIAQKVTTGPVVGGTLYAIEIDRGENDWMTMPSGKKFVDLPESMIAAGCVPKHKPHMVIPSPDGKHTAITYTGDQDFSILKNDEHKVLFCPTVDFLKPSVFGGATHSGAWFGSAHFLLLDMTGCVNGVCGGAVYKFKFTFDSEGTMKSTAFESALGVSGVTEARKTSATKPISLGTNEKGSFGHRFYVTDAKGAGSIMDANTMEWVKHFTADEFGGCEKGGLWTNPHPDEHDVIVAQYGQQAPNGANCIFKIDLAALTISKLVQLEDDVDTHGLQFCTRTLDGVQTVMVTNRATATLDVIKYEDGSFLLQGYDMNKEVFDKLKLSFTTEQDDGKGFNKGKPLTQKLQPDVAYLHDNGLYILYMAARGPRPVSAVKAFNFRENAHPGMMALIIDPVTCLPAEDQSKAFARTTFERSPEVTSDVHALWGVPNRRKTELWVLDQAGTGSVQTFHVFSACPAEGATNIHDNPPF
jgi:hypothetical protein